MSDRVIPYRLRAICFAKQAILLEKKYGILETVEISIGNSVVPNFEYSGVLSDVSQPAVSMAILHSRCLLEFLGMGIDRNAKPVKMVATKKARTKSDIGIEHFVDLTGSPLQMLTPATAIALLGRTGEFKSLTEAWATTFVIANQRLAHSTNDEILNGDHAGNAIEMTLDTIPELLCKALYDSTGRDRPTFN